MLESRRQVDFTQLMRCFLKGRAAHDCKINGPPEVDKILVGLILDLEIPFYFLIFIFRTFVTSRVIIIFVQAACFLAKYFRLETLICLLVFFVFRVVLEDIQC